MSQATQDLHDAVRRADLNEIRQLIHTGANPNAKDVEGNTALCITENPEVVHLLLALGANPNLACDDGSTPLIIAVMGVTPAATIQELLDAGANPNTSGGFGMTPLMHAATGRESEVVEILLAAGANATDVDKLGKSVAHFARKRPEILAMLSAHTQSKK